MNDDFPVGFVLFVLAVLSITAAVPGCGSYTQDGVTIRVIAGCEYIESGIGSSTTRTHKANCTNAMHAWNQ